MSPPEEKARVPEDTRVKSRNRSIRAGAPRAVSSPVSLAQVSRRLEHMYEIGKRFASFGHVEQPLDPVLAIVSKSLPLRSAIVIETYDDRSRMIVWPCAGHTAEQMRIIKEHAVSACRYLAGAPASDAVPLVEQLGATPLTFEAGSDDALEKRLIVLPLVVSSRPSFGILQLESAQPLGTADLMFVNAIANQLAIAIDRDRAWQHDVKLRALAEEGRLRAEVSSAAAQRDRAIAESAREKSEELARDNSRLYEQAQKAVQARELVLEIVAHDLKNPLGAILLITQILEQKPVAGEPPPDFSQRVARIQRSAQSMLRLITDLLDFSSIDAGHLALKCEPQDAGSLLQEALASFANAAQAKNLQLTAAFEPGLSRVVCDRGRILQVLSNLVGNAIHATADGGHVTLRIEAHGVELVFAVEDDGPGISQDDVKHLFDRYWRSSQVEYVGTGLGLAIASGIVAAHGSWITVESEPGKGATFRFALPASAADAAIR